MPSTTLLSSRSCTFINILGMWPICQGKGQSLYWRVKIKRVVLLSETLHKKAFTLCPYLQKYLILKSNTIISSKMLKAFTCQKNTAVLPFLNWLSIIPIMLAVWLAGWNVHLVSKYSFLYESAYAMAIDKFLYLYLLGSFFSVKSSCALVTREEMVHYCEKLIGVVVFAKV